MKIPNGRDGNAEIKHFTVSENEAKMTMLRSIIHGDSREYVEAGDYIMLKIDGEIMMSNTQMELDTNLPFIANAKGRVLIGGLGIGMVIHAIKDELWVKEIIVIEQNPSVIRLVAKHIVHPKLTVIEGDIYKWTPRVGEKFDTIYFDIWANKGTDNLKDMRRLHNRFKEYLAPGGWMDSWVRGDIIAKDNKQQREIERIRKEWK
jgi:spermidine synthase